jgi:hypothetical protein
MSKETDAIRQGLAQYHAAEYDRDGHDFWRDVEKDVLEASVKDHVRRNSPEDTSHEEVHVLTMLTLKELAKRR